MDDTTPCETLDSARGDQIERAAEGGLTGSAGQVWDTVQALGGPTAVGTGISVAAKMAKDIVVSKIQANAQIEVARIENGYRMEGGTHRADD